MKQSRFYIIASLPLLVLILIAVVYDLNWLSTAAEILTFSILILGFYKRLDFSNLNFSLFFLLSLAATGLKFLRDVNIFYFSLLIIQMASYIFLIREALKHTQRESGNKLMRLFFFLMIATNVYFVFGHFQEIENRIGEATDFGLYSMYYLLLLVLSIVGLVYYLNSYSRKSVFFITLVMSILVSDILRDMAIYYLPDTSVLLLHSFLDFVGIILAFQFFVTPEKKLKLINLV